MANETLTKLEFWQGRVANYLAGVPDPVTQALDKLETWQASAIKFLETPVISPPPPQGTAPSFPHRIGAHWIPGNVRQSDLDYFSVLRPGVIKVISLDPTRYTQALARLDPSPDSIIVARDHPLSEQHDDMRRDPVACGKAHALSWMTKVNSGGRLSWIDPKRFLFCGINEPSISNPAEEEIVAAYTKEFLTNMAIYGLRCLVFNFSTGWPRNVDTATIKNTKPIWNQKFVALEGLINASGSMIGLHEYWRDKPSEGIYTAPNGDRWGWNAYRHLACPMQCKIIIGECGLTKEVNGVPAPGQSKGWVNNLSPQAYAAQLWEYAGPMTETGGCHPNVMAVLPFTTNYESDDWKEDDTAGAHADILARVRGYTWPIGSWPIPVGQPTTEPPEEPPVEGDPMYKLVWPKMPRITTWFGPTHSGLDIAIPTGTPLYAMWDGVVGWSDLDDPTVYNGGYGQYIRIFYPQLGIDSFFGHMSRRDVKTGDKVVRGQQVGLSGSTGNSTGPHLHLEIRAKKDNSVVDRPGVGPFGRGQIDPMTVRWVMYNLYGIEEK